MENNNQDENQPTDPLIDPVEDKTQNIEETIPMLSRLDAADQNNELGATAATLVGAKKPDELSDLPADLQAELQADLQAELQVESSEGKGHETTGPVIVAQEGIPAVPKKAQPPEPKQKRTRIEHSGRKPLPWFIIPLLGLGFLLLVLLLSGFGGYTSGIGQRKSAEKTQAAQVMDEQFQLGLQDMEQGAYSRALQRFEYVVKLDPSYPGITEKLAEVMLEINTTATPTLLPTGTLTPTPDTRDSEQLFAQAEQALAVSDWSGAIDNLLALRKADAAFRAIDVDGMLFLALRNQGRDKILKEADLEGGMYDLTLANKFGPLDAEASGLLSWSELYITGASFWGIDWEQAVNYFSQVAPQLPNLMDGSKMTATERLRQALFELGNTQASNGQFCKAVRSYQQSLAIAQDPSVQQAGELAAKNCEGGGGAEATPKPNKKNKATPSP